MNNKIEELLDRYDVYFEKGYSAYGRGDLFEAMEYLKLAAERLFQIADFTEGELKEARINTAYELLDFIEEIDTEAESQKQPAQMAEPDEKTAGEKKRVCPVSPAPKPDITLSDVAGLANVKKIIQEKLIDPFLFPDINAEFGTKSGGGILLYGPPGTGKTMIARAIAGEVDATFYAVLPGDIMSKWVGNPEKNIKALFDEARTHKRSVIFFDEIDGLASSRSRSEDYMRRLVNQLLAEIQGFEQSQSSVLFIGATNHPELIDPAMLRPGRLDELVFVPLPDAPARRELWRMDLSRRKRKGRFDYDKLTDLSEGYSGSEIALLCDKAAVIARQRAISGDEMSKIEMQDILDVMNIVSPRTPGKDIDSLMEFAGQYDQNLENIREETISEDLEKKTFQFNVYPKEIEMESFIDDILRPFPKDPGLVGPLSQLCEGFHVAQVMGLIAGAIKICFGVEHEEFDQEFRLSLGHFVHLHKIDEPEKKTLEVEKPPTIVPDKLHDREKDREPARLLDSERGREILSSGMDILDRYRGQLSNENKDQLEDYLYNIAYDADRNPEIPPLDLISFEQRIILALKDNGKPRETAEDVAGLPFEHQGAGDTRSRAMGLIADNREFLNTEDIRGLTDDVKHSREIELDSFSRRVKILAESRKREKQYRQIRDFLEQSRDVLDDDEIEKIESSLKDPDVDYEPLIAMLQEKTLRRKLARTVSRVAVVLDVDKRISLKIQRKCIRALEKTGAIPSEASVLTHLKVILADYEKYKRRAGTGEQEQAPMIDDVKELILPPSTLDLSDVAGMDLLKNEMEFSIEVPINPKKRAFYKKVTGDSPENAAMLLYGTPGCGKTFLSKAVAMEFANRYGFKVINVSQRAIDGLHYTKKCPRIVEIFNLAGEISPSIVIWDEFDGIASPPMFSNRKYNATICSELKAQFEGMVKSEKQIVHIATSNYPWDLEPALMRQGRLGRLIHVLPPDFAARKEIIEFLLVEASVAQDVDYDELSEKTAGMTISEIVKAIKDAGQQTFEKGVSSINTGRIAPRITMAALKHSIEKYPAVDFRTWLTTATRHLNLPKYQCQREFFQKLLKDANAFLSGKKLL